MVSNCLTVVWISFFGICEIFSSAGFSDMISPVDEVKSICNSVKIDTYRGERRRYRYNGKEFETVMSIVIFTI